MGFYGGSRTRRAHRRPRRLWGGSNEEHAGGCRLSGRSTALLGPWAQARGDVAEPAIRTLETPAMALCGNPRSSLRSTGGKHGVEGRA